MVQPRRRQQSTLPGAPGFQTLAKLAPGVVAIHVLHGPDASTLIRHKPIKTRLGLDKPLRRFRRERGLALGAAMGDRHSIQTPSSYGNRKRRLHGIWR